MFTKLANRYAQAVVRYRWIVLMAALAVTVLLASQVRTLQLNNDPDIWAPETHEFTRTTRELERVFGGRNITVIGIVAKEGDIYDPKILEKIRNIQQGIEALPDAVKQNVVSLAARRVKDIQGNDAGMSVREMLAPMPQSPAELEWLKQAVARNGLYQSALVSRDGKAAAIIGDFNVAGATAAYAPIYEQILQVVDAQRDDSVDILLGGQPVHAANLEFAMQKMPIYFGIAFLIIMCVQYFAFRSVQGMLLPMLTGILAVIWGLGVLSIAGLQMDALNTTTPILIMAIATGHAVQILKRYYEELEKLVAAGEADLRVASRAAVVASLSNVAPIMLTAGLIAAAAFFSMCFSDIKMIRNFGVFAGGGVLAALVLELTLIPALRALISPRRIRAVAPGRLHRALSRLADVLTSPRSARVVIGASALIVAIVSAGVLRLSSDNSFKQYFHADSTVLRDDAQLNRYFGGTDSIAFLIEGAQNDAIKNARVLNAMAKLQAYLESQPHVGKTQSLADLIKRMHQAMHNEAAEYGVIPDSSELIAQYLLLYSSSGDPQDFDTLVDSDYRRAVVWTYLKTDSTVYAQSLYEGARALIEREFPPGITVGLGGSVPQTAASNESLVNTKLVNIVQMAAIVFVFATLVFRSFVGGLLVVIPLAAIVLMNLGVMGWLGTPLDMGTATVAAMVVGLGADYEIYMLFRLREEYRRTGTLDEALRASLLTSGKAVLFVALSIAGGYSALLLSDFEFYPRLGATMMTTMVISAALSLIFLRALVLLLRPRFIVGDASQAPLAELVHEGAK